MSKATHFCAGIHLVRQADGKYQILGATSNRFPDEVKLPGGTNENAPWEDTDQTFVREFSEETGITPVSFLTVHTEQARGHTKHFLFCREVNGQFNGPKTVKEPDGDEITIKFWDLAQFNRQLFENHRVAFMKACIVLRKIDDTFSKYYPQICERLDRGY